MALIWAVYNLCVIFFYFIESDIENDLDKYYSTGHVIEDGEHLTRK